MAAAKIRQTGAASDQMLIIITIPDGSGLSHQSGGKSDK